MAAGATIVEMQIDGRDVEVDHTAVTAIFQESLYGSSNLMYHIRDTEWDRWEKLATATTPPIARVRWSIETEKDQVYGDWKIVRCMPVRYRYYPDGIEIWLRGVDPSYVLTHRCHRGVFREMKISEIVEWIASKNGLKFRVASTLGKFILYQTTMTDADFITRTLIPLAVDASDEGGFYCYMEDGKTLVFEPPDIGGGEDLDTFGIKIVGQEANFSNISTLDVDFRGLDDSERSLELVGFDMLEKQAVSFVANDSTVPYKGLAKVKPQAPDVPRRIEVSTGPDLDFRREQGIKSSAIAMWSYGARSLYRVPLKLPTRPDARPGQTVVLSIQDPSGKLHFPSGRWLVSQVEHYRGTRGAYTELTLERRTQFAQSR